MNTDNYYIAIMAGGIGSRFWPSSREHLPKQFLDILGVGKSLIRLTYERFTKLVPPERILVVTNKNYKELVAEHIPEIPVSTLCSLHRLASGSNESRSMFCHCTLGPCHS